MKNIILYLLIILFIILFSCEKDNNSNEKEDFQFEATVLNQGLDCGETFLIELKKNSSNSELSDGTYYADGLPEEFKQSGLKIYLNCRESANDEIYVCTTLGPGLPHIVVINCIAESQ